MSQAEMADRIAARIRESGGSLGAATIASEFLRLTSARGASAAALVRAILSRDARFRETAPGEWALRRISALPPPVVLCALEIPPSARREPWLWRIHATLWEGEPLILRHQGAQPSDELRALLEWLRHHPAATRRPGSLGRWIGAQERLQALPETDCRIVDLRGWERLLGHADRETVAAEAEAEPERELVIAAKLLPRILSAARKRGLRSWGEVARFTQTVREEARARVWNEEWAFTPQEIHGLPQEPGIYRFLAGDGSPLYIGKARDLRSRVSSYFRPLEAGSERRGELLRQIRGFSYEVTGTELEALIREARAIRERRPPWNVQIDFGPEPRDYPLGEQDLLLLLPGEDGETTLFLLAGPRVAIGSLDAFPAVERLGEALRAFFIEERLPDGLEEVSAPERLLVRRWMGWESAGGARFRLTDFPSCHSLAVALRRAASGASPGDGETNARTIVRDSE